METVKELRNYKVKRRIVSDFFPNVSMIHPLKQKQVYDLINHIKSIDEVNKVIIFGSSVSNKCHNGSDLDFYLDLSRNVNLEKTISSFMDNYDYWNNFSVDKRLLDEINKKGVVVYERKDDA